MKVLQNLYYIYKIPSDKIQDLKTYSFKEASRDGSVVSIGDNLVLAKIREYYGDTRDHTVLYNRVQNIRKEMKQLKKEKTSQSNVAQLKLLQSELDGLLFVEDIINIKVVTKKQYAHLARHGFDLNGKHYIRFMVGSGQMRRNTVTFVNEKLVEFLSSHLMCGLKDKIQRINLAKLSAYYALAFSSVLWVRKPRVCIIKDFDTIIQQQKVEYIYKDEHKKNQIEERILDIKLNSADGQGLISPDMAKLWSDDMHLQYTPCSFVIRTAFIKGNLVTFDFKEYARQHDITTITDRYGTVYNIDEIDVLVSESQFKMAKYYSSWEGYTSYHDAYNLKWGVARYNKEFDGEYVLTNYQYIQTLNLTRDETKAMVNYTVDWIRNICSGNTLYTLLYNIGVKDNNQQLEKIINSCGSNFTKAILKNSDMLNDGYVQRKIYNTIKESIREAKLGRIWVRGNYQFMISDPVAQCQSALGLKPSGLIPADNIYSNFWNQRDINTEIVACRSPLTYYSEINPLSICQNDEMNYWYKYLYSGIIYSIHDISVVRHADSDFDGDIIFTTNDEYFIKGARRETLPITYEKQAVPTQKITLPNQIKCDIRGLDTKVGQITNYSTSMIAMLPLFKSDKQTEQRLEVEKRIKLCRELQGAEIDKIKGTTPPSFPKEWKNWVYINSDDDDIVKADKYKYNSMVVKKKPYFFIYLYGSLMSAYKEYNKNFNNLSMKNFGMKINDLIKKQNKINKEINLVRKYQKYSPILETDCVMNNLCKSIEDVDFDIKYNPNANSLLPTFCDRTSINNTFVDILYLISKEYKAKKKFKGLSLLVDNEGIQDDDINNIMQNVLYASRDECRERLYEVFSSSKELFNHLVAMCQKYNIGFDFVWDMLGDDIIDIIPQNNSLVAVEDGDGLEYLGRTYNIKEVVNVAGI